MVRPTIRAIARRKASRADEIGARRPSPTAGRYLPYQLVTWLMELISGTDRTIPMTSPAANLGSPGRPMADRRPSLRHAAIGLLLVVIVAAAIVLFVVPT